MIRAPRTLLLALALLACKDDAPEDSPVDSPTDSPTTDDIEVEE